MKIDRIKAFQNLIGIDFDDRRLLTKALTHRSCEKSPVNNERLEFLGDSVLGLVITEYLYRRYRGEAEGFLAKIKAYLVSSDTLFHKAEQIDLGKYMIIGKGEEKSGGRKRISILADAMEAIIGAVYLEKGLDTSRRFVLNLYKEDLKKANINLSDYYDYKTVLQEYVQKTYRKVPVYKITNERGPDHQKIFDVEVIVNNEVMGYGSGHSKKEAEQIAAKQAYCKITSQEG